MTAAYRPGDRGLRAFLAVHAYCGDGRSIEDDIHGSILRTVVLGKKGAWIAPYVYGFGFKIANAVTMWSGFYKLAIVRSLC